MTETESNAYFSGYQAGLAAVFTEKEVLIRRIDELCEQVEYDRQTSRSRLKRIDQLKDENAKLIVKLNAEHIVRQNVEVENAKLRELAVSYDSALHRMCSQMQGHVDCHDCVLGKDYGDDSCAIDELREAAYVVKVELE